MTELLSLPWLEAAVLVPVVGALVVGRLRVPDRTMAEGLGFAALTLACACLATAAAALDVPPAPRWDVQHRLLGTRVLSLDDLNAPLLPTVALLYLLTAVATGRTKLQRFSFPWSLASLGLQMAAFGCTRPWVLIGLLAAGAAPPVVELLNRGRPVRVYVLHLGLFLTLLVAGWALVDVPAAGDWAAGLLLVAVLIRCGVFPAHVWLTDWFEHASFGRALLFVAPLTGVYAAIRLVLPVAPDWVLRSIGLWSLGTAVYAAGMATVQQEARRFFAFLFLSHASLVLVGLELHTSLTLTGSLRLWSSVILSLGGLGLTLRALEARVGRLALTRFHGLYEHSPALAVSFLVTGLASVGFPGTAGFIAADLLVDGAVGASPWVGVGVIAAAALNGIAVVRAYFLLFTGARHGATLPLGITWRERVAVLTLAVILVGGGLAPQAGVASGYRAAEQILKGREARLGRPAGLVRAGE
jgi:NADH-quinone oxidoreductase subunit M